MDIELYKRWSSCTPHFSHPSNDGNISVNKLMFSKESNPLSSISKRKIDWVHYFVLTLYLLLHSLVLTAWPLLNYSCKATRCCFKYINLGPPVSCEQVLLRKWRRNLSGCHNKHCISETYFTESPAQTLTLFLQSRKCCLNSYSKYLFVRHRELSCKFGLAGNQDKAWSFLPHCYETNCLRYFSRSPSAFELGRNTLQLTSILCSSATKEEDF